VIHSSVLVARNIFFANSILFVTIMTLDVFRGRLSLASIFCFLILSVSPYWTIVPGYGMNCRSFQVDLSYVSLFLIIIIFLFRTFPALIKKIKA
jgi:hypothetical protein